MKEIKNRYGRKIDTIHHKVDDTIMTGDGNVYRIIRMEGRIPCNGGCAFGVNGVCARPDGIEPCTFINRIDNTNVRFEFIGHWESLMDKCNKEKEELNRLKLNIYATRNILNALREKEVEKENYINKLDAEILEKKKTINNLKKKIQHESNK